VTVFEAEQQISQWQIKDLLIFSLNQ